MDGPNGGEQHVCRLLGGAGRPPQAGQTASGHACERLTRRSGHSLPQRTLCSRSIVVQSVAFAATGYVGAGRRRWSMRR